VSDVTYWRQGVHIDWALSWHFPFANWQRPWGIVAAHATSLDTSVHAIRLTTARDMHRLVPNELHSSGRSEQFEAGTKRQMFGRHARLLNQYQSSVAVGHAAAVAFMKFTALHTPADDHWQSGAGHEVAVTNEAHGLERQMLRLSSYMQRGCRVQPAGSMLYVRHGRSKHPSVVAPSISVALIQKQRGVAAHSSLVLNERHDGSVHVPAADCEQRGARHCDSGV